VLPMYGPDGNVCSAFAMTPGAKGDYAKGCYAKGKPVGLFLPEGRLPKPGETWLVVEGVKDAAALHALGFANVAGLPGNAMNPKFATVFSGAHVVIIPDCDKAGREGATKTAKALQGVAASVSVALLPALVKDSHGDDVRDVIRAQGLEAVKKAIDEAKPAGEVFVQSAAVAPAGPAPASALPPLAPGTRVRAGDRGNIGEVVEDHGQTVSVHFVSPEGQDRKSVV
jgi:5S rRNA maturation endonuclease (ribonuclease M5)